MPVLTSGKKPDVRDRHSAVHLGLHGRVLGNRSRNLRAGVSIYEPKGRDQRVTAYRWYVADPVDFTRWLDALSSFVDPLLPDPR